MGKVTVTGVGNLLNERNEAIRLRLSYPEPFLEKQAGKLLDLIYDKVPSYTGLLSEAFLDYHLYQTANSKGGPNAVGIGDPNILTKPKQAPKGTLTEFIEWWHKQQTARQQAGKAKWQQVKAERAQTLKALRKEEHLIKFGVSEEAARRDVGLPEKPKRVKKVKEPPKPEPKAPKKKKPVRETKPTKSKKPAEPEKPVTVQPSKKPVHHKKPVEPETPVQLVTRGVRKYVEFLVDLPVKFMGIHPDSDEVHRVLANVHVTERHKIVDTLAHEIVQRHPIAEHQVRIEHFYMRVYPQDYPTRIKEYYERWK